MHLSLEFSAVCLGASTGGMLLSLAWYKATQQDALDRGTVLFFAKLWYGLGAAAIALGLFLKYG